MAAYRASRHESTGYSPNFLTLGRKLRGPVDSVYEETYESFVEMIRSRMTDAYSEVRKALKRSAKRNERYYDCKVRPQKYSVGQWVYYFNPRKFQGKQMKWMNQFSGPFLVIRTPSPVTVGIQKSRKAKPFIVHIDKVKPYLAATPKSWSAEPNLMDSDEQYNDEVVAEHQLSQLEEVRLVSEVIPTTSSPNSM